MRIGIDIRLIGKNRTGDEAVFFNLTKNLAKIDSENEYLLFTDVTDEGKLSEILKRLEIEDKRNFKIISIETKNRFSWNFLTLPAYLRKNPVDVYLTQYIVPFFVPKKIKIVTIIHDISFNFFPQFIRKSDLLFLKTLIPLSIEKADKVLGVSRFTRDEIVKFYKTEPEKVDFFHNAVSEDFKSQDVSEEKLREVKKKYGLPEKFFLYVGTLQPRKNIPFLLESYAQIKDKTADTKLVLVGNRQAHNFDARIDEAVRKHNLEEIVVFPGFIDEQDKAAVYKLAHVFVFPSLYEGFGIPVLESFEMGTPVLAADIPSLREVGGDGALFADPESIDKFSKALYDISIEEKLRSELMSSGSRRAGLFSWMKTAEDVLGKLQCLANKTK
ncbi:MAG: Glycosyl transferase [Candidatus Moranbacteria bacterium GW2011_GWE2_47_10]|nr:MAG: Glycosyl transferase [Candidatus Moranbacteria bacterium GW2011_GWE2_47_10]